jgi:hypothetical protein
MNKLAWQKTRHVVVVVVIVSINLNKNGHGPVGDLFFFFLILNFLMLGQ